MSSLTDVYNQIASADAQLLEKQAAHIKLAEEEDAAGRIMARGFADELQKIAADAPLPKPPDSGTVKVKPFGLSTDAQKTPNVGAGGAKGTVRTPSLPPMKPIQVGKV